MNTQEERTVHFDQDLQIEAYRFHGLSLLKMVKDV